MGSTKDLDDLLSGQRKPEFSSVLIGLHPDFPAVDFDRHFTKRQPQAG